MPLPLPKPFEAFVEGGGRSWRAVVDFFQQHISPRVAVNARADYESIHRCHFLF